MNKNGFITLHRQILDWEWYKNTNTKVLFIHLLLKANYKDLSFEGHKILRGQLVTSLVTLSAELGMSIKQIRGSLEKLIATGEVASRSFPRYRVITIVKYDDYQIDGSLEGSQTADETAAKGQAEGSERASKGQAKGSERATSKQYNNNNKGIKEQGNKERERTAPARFLPPTREQVSTFCQEQGIQIDVDRFIDYYTSNGWKVGSSSMKSWEAAVRNWARRDKEKPAASVKKVVAQNYSQRDYGSVDDDIMADVAKEMERFKSGGGDW